MQGESLPKKTRCDEGKTRKIDLKLKEVPLYLEQNNKFWYKCVFPLKEAFHASTVFPLKLFSVGKIWKVIFFFTCINSLCKQGKMKTIAKIPERSI